MHDGFAAALGAWRERPGPLARSLADAVREAVVDGRLPPRPAPSRTWPDPA
ncbi:hypothetical protein OHU34_05300 [Streptomyces sp. NBC_00080]|uniref:hypothetical protein n=1 Tax=Streptomyces sp. NBC_00080 TaxID=2975645 RepID=UPI003255B52C